ncbi:hypothetical protein, partial [Acinetobacter pittii]|uniref:hypothetical protein n=1 Tax=Acinetobacter pittii TaxID=48296 RepID=UPI00168D6496
EGVAANASEPPPGGPAKSTPKPPTGGGVPRPSLKDIQAEQSLEHENAHDSDFLDELTDKQFNEIIAALEEQGCMDETGSEEDLGRIEALLPMRAARLESAVSLHEPRVFFRTIDKESIVVYDQTGSPLDEIIKLVVKKANSWIANEGIRALNERRELDALKRKVPIPPKLTAGRLKLYFRPSKEEDLNPPNLRDELANISKDLYLWLGRDESNAKLGENSALLKNMWQSWVVHKIESFLLKGKKNRNFMAVKDALSGLRAAGWVAHPNYVGNLRVIFGIINKFFFEEFIKQSYFAMQNSPYKLTAARINGELNFKSHNVDVLERCLTAEERTILTPWLTSKEAKELKTITKQVFSDGKFRLLPELANASNAWDKMVSKALLKL